MVAALARAGARFGYLRDAGGNRSLEPHRAADGALGGGINSGINMSETQTNSKPWVAGKTGCCAAD